MLNLGLLLGGPSAERGISLNSARSIADHLDETDIRLKEIIYFDRNATPYVINRGMLYCNTPSDFDFKLSQGSPPLTRASLVERLRNVDLVFPVIHGAFGEDGQIQAILEEADMPFVGSCSSACAKAFDKFLAHQALLASGMMPVPSVLVKRKMPSRERAQLVRNSFSGGKLVLKPARGGSSIDVYVTADRSAAIAILDELLLNYEDVVLQPRMTGVEVTTIVLAGPDEPTALLPIQIEIRNRRSEDDIFDYRRKYLASRDSHYHCPPPQDPDIIEKIRCTAEDVFRVLDLRDFARIDGWLQGDGQIIISDVNPISGMEQNSFLFIQAAQLGMSHQDVLRYIVKSAAGRYGLTALMAEPTTSARNAAHTAPRRRPIAVLFGGDTAERQVSVLSGTNVWLKLLNSKRFEPVPYLLDPSGLVWGLPYSATLRHSAEEILDACHDARRLAPLRESFSDKIRQSLRLSAEDLHAPVSSPLPMTMEEFLSHHDIVFLGLHGGAGEDGSMQAMLDARGIKYNGSGERASRLCMDKYETGLVIAELSGEGIYTAKRVRADVPDDVSGPGISQMWSSIVAECGSRIIVKPLDDGCSAGVVPLESLEEFSRYLSMIRDGATQLSGIYFSLLDDEQIVELPAKPPGQLIFEEFIETDDVRVVDGEGGPARLAWGEIRNTGWVEVTVGVIGCKGAMRALNPSVAVVKQGVLSLEEKFMGGTGVNITPPPTPPLGRVQVKAIDAAKERVARVADVLGLAGYARIDAFMHRETGELIVIEANTLPGLTPSTVFFHQCLAENPPIAPRAVLEEITELALASPDAGK